jgi:hypothetical protein
VPVAPAVAPAVPLAMPVAAAAPPPSSELFRPPSEDWQPALTRRPRRRNLGSVIVLLAIFTVLGAGATVGVVAWLRVLRNQADTEGAKAPIKLDYAMFNVPDVPWRPDNDAANSMHASLGLRREDGSAWMALTTKDYRDHNPRDAKLVEEAIVQLKRYFGEGVEWELKEDDEVGGETAKKLVFQGELNSNLFSGECCTVAHKGIGYWFYTWKAGSMDELERAQGLRSEFAELRKGLSFKERSGWKGDRTTTTVELAGKKGDYTLTDADGIWKKRKAEDYDVAADLALVADDRESKDADKRAEVVVLRLPLPEDGNLVEAARTRLEEIHKAEGYEGVLLEPAIKSKTPAPNRIGAVPGKVLMFKVTDTRERQRLALLGIVKRPQEYLLFKCECDWRFRNLWEADFLQLLSTYQRPAK